VKLEEEWVYPHMGFEKKKLIKFDSPKTFAYRADIDELAKYTLKLLTDDSLREKMGKNAREHVAKNLDYKLIAKKIAEITAERLDLKKAPLVN